MNIHLMYLEFKEIKTHQDPVMIMTEGKHYRVMRSDLEDFKKVFMLNNRVS